MRPELTIIAEWIKPGTQVLDLGCGNGELLEYLTKHKEVWGVGLEIDQSNIADCIRRGVNVVQSNLDEGLAGYFTKQSFDYVVMTQTLQAMRRPDRLLDEMLSVGKVGIVTFPNMGHWRCRMQLGMGHMPMTAGLPNPWYSTENIHLCTIADFECLCREKNIHIKKRELLGWAGRRGHISANLSANLFGQTAVYLLENR